MSAPTATAPHGGPFLSGRDTAPAYWAFGVLWVVLVQTAAHVLNGYTPGGFEQVIKGLGTPAPRRELPPADLGFEPRTAARLVDNLWSASADTAWARSWTQ